jgi:cob(I)alamin adenosyltransferase
MKKSMVYTRTGDKGTTSLVGGQRVAKSDIRLESYGTVDELNSHIGLLISLLHNEHDVEMLTRIQKLLFVVGSNLATDQSNTELKAASVVHAEDILMLENEIDVIDEALPQLRAFVLPGGCQASSQCHVCRTVCRRAERRILSLEEQAEVQPELLQFINRLSDYLFVLARKINIDEKKSEIFW